MRSATVAALLAISISLPLMADPLPAVHSATVDPVTNVLTIRGLNFGSTPPRVMLNATGLSVLTSSDTEITAQLPSDLTPGTYLLTIARPPAAVTTAFVVTVGAVGPAGPRGPSGLLDLAGKVCGAGTFLTGFGPAGELVCAAVSAPGAAPFITSASATTPGGPFITFAPVIVSVSAADADGDLLSYESHFLSVPAGSQAALTGVFSAHPTFVPDLSGPYVVAVTAIDPAGHRSQPAEVDVVVAPCGTSAPVVMLSANGAFAVGQRITLDVLVDETANAACAVGFRETYDARFASLPTTAQVQMIGASTPHPSFIPDVAGSYSVVVTVTNNIGLKGDNVITVVVP